MFLVLKVLFIHCEFQKKTKSERSERSERERRAPGMRIVNLLLLISDGEKKHFCVIKSLSWLLSSQVTKHDHAKSFCLNCLNHLLNEEKLEIHKEYCRNNEADKN